MIRRIACVSALLLSAGCGASQDEPADQQTQRERDSTIAESNLPGAQGVGKGLDVADSAAARAARLDSLSGN